MRTKRVWYVVILMILLLSASSLSKAQPKSSQVVNSKSIYHGSWIDFNKNGKKDVYEDPKANIDKRIDDLLRQMTVEEKTVQMATLYGFGRVLKDELPTAEWKREIWKDGIANIDEQLNGVAYTPQAATQYSWPPSKHARAINEIQRFFVEETRLGIPVDFTNEGISGLCHRRATSFPVQIGQGSTWDRHLIRRIGTITGREAKVLGYTNVYSPILDLARDPRWGRVVECYSEDPFLASELGVQMVEGIQSEGVAATAKHFAVYSVPKGGRDGEVRTDPHETWHEVNEILLKPFKAAVSQANVLGLMVSYNDYDGTPIAASHFFMIDLLKKQWGFNGYLVSDSSAVEFLNTKHHVAADYEQAVYLAVMGGLNVRTNFSPPEVYVNPLRRLVEKGKIPMSVINDRVRDVLRVKFMLGLFDAPYVKDPDAADSIISNPEFDKVSLQSSRESLVLLKNEGLLPLNAGALKSVLVTGPNAKAINPMISRYGPSDINVISVYEGIKQLVGDRVDVKYSKGCDHYDVNWPENELYDKPIAKKQKDMIQAAVDAAKDADVIVAVVGDDEKTVGESRSRTSLDLPGNQEDLVEALHKTGKPVVVVLLNGRPMTINWIDKYVPAVLEAWFPSEYAGQVVAEALFGLYNPGGKLPVTFPKSVGQIPFNFPYKYGSQTPQTLQLPERFTSMVSGALYPFGFGLSYTQFKYDNLVITPAAADETKDIKVSCTITNTGKMKGDEVVQLYTRDVLASVVTYDKRLSGFERVTLEPSESRTVEFIIKPRKHLTLFNANMKEVVEPGEFDVLVGSSSEDIRLRGKLTIKPFTKR